MQPSLLEANGFIFFNDPHIASRKPGRRKDADYAATILGKLQHVIKLANDKRLIPLCTGDLFDAPRDMDDSLKTRLQTLFRSCWTDRFIMTPGNHDMEGGRLSDGDSLAVIASSGLVQIPRDGGPVDIFLIRSPAGGHFRIGVGVTPHGQVIPDTVDGLFDDVDGVVWMTHHDLAFDGVYPGAIELKEIAGCGLVMNGHMHIEKAPISVGETMWCNFGSLSRTDISLVEHIPSAWEFHPETGMTRHIVPHKPNVIDLTGRLIQQGPEPVGKTMELEESDFANLLALDLDAGPEATKDGTFIRDELQLRRDSGELSNATYGYILDLLNHVTAASA